MVWIGFRHIWSPLPVVHAATDEETEFQKKWTEYYKKFHGVDPDNQTPKERLRLTLQSLYQQKGWEWDFVWMTFHSGLVFAGSIGCMVRSNENRLLVIRKYSEVQFDHPYLVERKMRDQHYMRNVKNGWRLGWRVAVFSSVMLAGSLCSLSYRNYVNPLDFAAVTALTAAVWRWQTGPRGQLITAGIAGCGGLLVGSIIWAMFKLSGTTVSEFRLAMGTNLFRQQAKDRRDTIRDFGKSEGLELMQEREVMLMQRRAWERMKRNEAELAAKQKELANSVSEKIISKT